ncbi:MULTISPECIES: cupin-like domain-containing protein [Rheinheimera]|uniref:Cupin-like domain-containing protein n=1 Tax=Rheinheimera aquimaris TaxID=412437 RepID=A0ABP3NRZ7_9GAMM|nr:cupin-like domain-containing protein [Rheinheimera aquimaris]MCB5213491.1 cupin-like domain-containing protein [Rheinheimera aquimaris]MCD1597344.1 cupin-like domain-containing protein [Rheinheimera aquimaris]|tara:strand:- start:3001 stop:4014 length:1014 start_codon:yes stop_codon:yes gene_type:complete
MAAVAEYFDVDKSQFWQQIIPSHQPAILRQAVKHWPSVVAAGKSDLLLQEYFAGLESRKEVNTILAHPDTKGRLTYNDTLTGFNFERQKAPVTAVLNELRRIAGKKDALHIAVQSARTDVCLPEFSNQNVMPLLDTDVVPRIWAGNKIVVPAHFDDADNLACVVAGKRRFTLFPPDQVSNLYIGPLDFTPAGAPVSLVDITAPDMTKFPRFEQALEQAQIAELEPGDVLFIPALWWHHVESLSAVNVLINYWWGGSLADDTNKASPFDSLLHTLLTIKQLPEHQRKHWQALFGHFVFHDASDPCSHLPKGCGSVQGELTEPRKEKIVDWLQSQIKHL